MGMKVKLLCEFEVMTEEDDELEEHHARSAASEAAYNFLSFVEISGVRTDTEWVEVYVDGFGKCMVKVGEEHE